MTADANRSHPLAESRRRLLLEAARLGGCLRAYQERGDWSSKASLERALEYIGESVRILDKLIAATSPEGWGDAEA